jgi:biopolymer transport protein ExbB
MTKYKQVSNKVKLMKLLFHKQQGSVANAIKSALVKYQAVKKKDSIVKKLQKLFKRNRRSYSLEMPMLQKNMTIISL